MTRPRVLVIEDDASIRRFVELALEEEPIELVQAASLGQALQVVQQRGPFTLLLTDLMLPDGSGVHLLEAMAAEPALRAGAYVAVFSAGLSAERRAELEGLGVDEVIEKPASLGRLLACLQRALAATPRVAPGSPAAAGRGGEHAAQRAAAVAHYFAGDQALYDAYRASCLRQFVQDRQVGDAALAAGDVQALRRLAHSLKTVLLTLGHDSHSSLARQLESDAAEGRTDRLDAGWAMLARALGGLAAA